MANKKKFDKHLQKALKDVGILYVEGVKKQLKQDGTHASGNLAKSISYQIIDESVDISMAKYGKAVEDGSSPASQGTKWVSTQFISDIMEWMSFKRIGAGKNQKKIANAIARGIKKEGIIKRFNGGSKMLDKAYNKLERRIGDELSAAYLKDLKHRLNNL